MSIISGKDGSGNIIPVSVDSTGKLNANITGAGSGGTSSTDEDAFAAGSSAGTAAMGAYESSPTALTNGQIGIIALDANRNVKVNVVAGAAGGGAATVADGADVAEGATTDAKVTGDNAGTLSAKLRGLTTILANVWDSVNGWLKVSIQNTTLAVTQSGTWTVQPGNTANTTAWKVDGSAVTQPVSAATLPLPSGASTAAKQPALGTAGSASADVISVQGIASMTPLLATSAGDIAHDSADSGNPVKVGGKAATAFPTAVSANDRTNLLTDIYGRPFVRVGREGPAGAVWTAIHVPASNTQATATKAAGAAGVRNVCTGFTATIAATGTAPSATNLTISLIDGASGGGTYLWRSVIAIPAVAGAVSAIVRGNLWLPGTAATAMTLEFSAAGGANTVESVSMEGTTVAE